MIRPAPCGKCNRKGCGSYHDICKPYNDWKKEEAAAAESKKEITRQYIPQSTFKSRKGIILRKTYKE